MLQLIKDQKVGLIVGVLSSAIFLYFVQPILEFLGQLFVISSKYIGSAYTDRIYQQVAHLETQDYSFIVFILIAGVPAATMFMASMKILFWREDSDFKITIKKTGPFRFIYSAVLIVAIILMVSILVSNFIQLSTISSFKRHIRIISPHITIQEERELISQWSQINSKQDYQKIYIKIETIAKNKGIILPDNKIYSLLSI